MPTETTAKRVLLWVWHAFNFGWVFKHENGKFTRQPNQHLKALKERRYPGGSRRVVSSQSRVTNIP